MSRASVSSRFRTVSASVFILRFFHPIVERLPFTLFEHDAICHADAVLCREHEPVELVDLSVNAVANISFHRLN